MAETSVPMSSAMAAEMAAIMEGVTVPAAGAVTVHLSMFSCASARFISVTVWSAAICALLTLLE